MFEKDYLLNAASRIVDSKEAEYVYQRTLEDSLRHFVAMRMGDEQWLECDILSNLLPNGQEVYTAYTVVTLSTGGSIGIQDRSWAWKPQRIMRCVVVARDEFGQFQIAPWSPVGGNE